MQSSLAFVVLCGLLACVSARPQFVYAGFDHLLVFDSSNMTVTAFDYRRHLPHHSACDAFVNPPLLTGALMEDWLSKEALSQNPVENLVYTHMGYEIVFVESKKTGAYLTRRCRDFRPQLTALPCEPLGTGQSDFLKDPYRTIFLGNSRVMILNSQTADFSIHVFDADVHTGGDPFRFSLGPLLKGQLPLRDGLDVAHFAYVQLKNHGGDVMLIHKDGTVQGWRFNGMAKDESEWYFKFAFLRVAPQEHTITTFGENRAIFYSNQYHFNIWDISENETKEVVVEDIMSGNAFTGHACVTDNVTECVSMEGCAWCPITYTCMAYEPFKSYFCDGRCGSPAIVDRVKAGDAIILPDCVKEVPVEANHAEIFDTIDEGYALLPGNMRLDRDYRKDVGDYANEEASPIHPCIDSVLGETVPCQDYHDELIDDKNNVAMGDVYRPSASEDVPCMNGGYDPKKAIEAPVAAVSHWRMNIPPQEEAAPTFAKSPAGESSTAAEPEPSCERKRNTTRTAMTPEKERFFPRAGEVPTKLDSYVPATTSTRHEEDLMNFDKTPFADIKGQMGVEAAKSQDFSRAPLRVEGPETYKPKEPAKGASVPKNFGPLIPEPPRDYAPTPVDVMNEGLKVATSLADTDCTETGGNDGYATPTMNAAMQNSVIEAMPETLEAQLNLFKHEEKEVKDTGMFPLTGVNYLDKHLPLSPEQPAFVPPVDFGTSIPGVSTDDEGDYVSRIAHKRSSS